MTRIKLLAVSTITAVMILGSTIVFAVGPGSRLSSDTSAEQPPVTTELVPIRSSVAVAAAGRALKK